MTEIERKNNQMTIYKSQLKRGEAFKGGEGLREELRRREESFRLRMINK